MRTLTQDSLGHFFNLNYKKNWYIKYARTYAAMYVCTKQPHYLKQARECLDLARASSIRLLDAISGEAA